MQHVVLVHFFQAERHFVETVPAKVFRVVARVIYADFVHGALVHQLQHNEHVVIVVIKLDASDKLSAIEVGQQAGLLYDRAELLILHILDLLHRKEMAVTPSFYLFYRPIVASSDIVQELVDFAGVLSPDFDRFVEQWFNLF